jgi:8-oxo-dGTP pyrophosphatase MutT (NUDIX family)
MPIPPPHDLAQRLASHDAPGLPESARRAAVALAIDWSSPAPKLLLMRRRPHPGDPWSGQISLPGGKTEPADPTAAATAIREAQEELTIDLATDARLLGQMPHVQAMAGGRRLDMWITPCVFEVTRLLTPLPSAEAEEAFWLPLDQAASGVLDHRFPYKDKSRNLLLPAWRFEERVIWGLTFRMISTLLTTFGTHSK